MMNIRQINLEKDYPTLCKWWTAHKVPILPDNIFPQGWMIEAGGVEIACSFLYLDVGGKFAVIEFLTTNPAIAFSKTLVIAVKQLLGHIEEVARKQGCGFAIGFVAPNTGEERLMQKLGWTTGEGPAHKMYAKLLIGES